MKQTQSVQTPSQPAVSASSALTEVSSVLAVIILLILLFAWLARRMGLAPKAVQARALKLSATVQVGQRERVVIVDVPEARLVLGVTAQQVTLLHTLPPASPEESLPSVAQQGADFRQMLSNLTKRSGKPQ